MTFSLAVVIPAKNEELTIESVIADIRSNYSDVAIIVVNDDSDDETASVVANLNVNSLNHLESLGAWKATQTGLIFARMQGYTHAITMDADGQHLGSEISKLIDVMESPGAPDVVIGACQNRASIAKKTAWGMFRKLSGLKVGDITSGFRMYNKKAIALLTSQKAGLLEFQDVGVLLLLKSSGLRIAEAQVLMDKRFVGKSRIFSSWYRILYYLVSTLIISISKLFHKSKSF